MIRRMIMVGTLVVVMSALFVQPALGFIARNTFQHEATMSQNGRHLTVTAQIACTAGERLTVEVTVTQQSTLAHGNGRVVTVCAPVDLDDENAFQEIPVKVVARGPNTFDSGSAIATGLAITTYRGKTTDLRQWQPAAGIAIQ